MSRGIVDDPEDEGTDEELEEVSNQDLSEMIFIVFNEVKALQAKLDEVLNGKG
jgi:hypothetical protein